MKKQAKVDLIMNTVLSFTGFGILIYIDWRIAFSIFLLLWGNNIQLRNTLK